MNITIQSPPALTGSDHADIAALSEWCGMFFTRLKSVLYSLDGGNISSLPPEKLSKGTLNADMVGISGALVNITGDSFEIATADGTHYIRCSDGQLVISANSISNG